MVKGVLLPQLMVTEDKGKGKGKGEREGKRKGCVKMKRAKRGMGRGMGIINKLFVIIIFIKKI